MRFAPIVLCGLLACSAATPKQQAAELAPAPEETPASMLPWRGVTGVKDSLDAEVHRELEGAFAGVERGAGVVMSTEGAILALYSTLPHNDEPGLAARHLASGRPSACGSVAKPFTALAALLGGAMTPATTHRCDGVLAVGELTFRCHAAHGALDLGHAMALSDNIFFFELARAMTHDDLADVQHAVGLGEPSPLLPDAPAGFVPHRSDYEGDGTTLRPGHTLSQSIGHGISVTPLQIARAYHALATGQSETLGAAWQPHLDIVRDAVRRSVTDADGTAHFAGTAPDVAGKTGTAETAFQPGEPTLSLGWFAGWAPASSPRIVFAFRVEGRTGRDVAQLVLDTVDRLGKSVLRPQ